MFLRFFEGKISGKSKLVRLQIECRKGRNQLELEGAVYSLSITIKIEV